MYYYYGGGFASSITKLKVYKFFKYRNGLLENCHNDGFSVTFVLFYVQIVNHDSNKCFPFFIAILEAFLSQFLVIRLSFLYFIYLESYSTNNRFVKYFINQLGSKKITKTLELEQNIDFIN